MADDLVYYQFTRDQVLRRDFAVFLEIFGEDQLPVSKHLRPMMNSMVFLVEGYDVDPREIHSIPEIRAFYSAFSDAWPYWLYFCSLDSDALLMMVLCCLPSIAALKRDGQPRAFVEFNQVHLAMFLRSHFEPMNLMCLRAGMSERMIYDRTAAVFAYFHLPFDAEPPE